MSYQNSVLVSSQTFSPCYLQVRRLIKTSKIQTKTFADVCLTGSTPDTRKKLQAFADLLEKCFTLDPDKRITAKQALAHPFISSARQMQK
jgi:serine/threonine protein kinase